MDATAELLCESGFYIALGTVFYINLEYVLPSSTGPLSWSPLLVIIFTFFAWIIFQCVNNLVVLRSDLNWGVATCMMIFVLAVPWIPAIVFNGITFGVLFFYLFEMCGIFHYWGIQKRRK